MASPSSPAAERDPEYWVLKSRGSFYHEDTGREVEPVFLEKIDLEEYLACPGRVSAVGEHGYTLHGRRINDEVELFRWDGGRTTPGLRRALKECGLIVRTYHEPKMAFPSPASLVTPERRMEEEEECDERSTIVGEYVEAMYEAIAQLEKDEGVPVPYAFLAEKAMKKKSKKQKVVLVCKVRPEDISRWCGRAMETISVNGKESRVLGLIEDRGLQWIRGLEKEIITFFKYKKGSDRYHVELLLFDLVAHLEYEEQQAQKAAKKSAKKQRRIEAASTDTTSKEALARKAEEEEAAQTHRREKAKAKKKAQKEKKKAEAAEAAEAAGSATTQLHLSEEDNRELLTYLFGPNHDQRSKPFHLRMDGNAGATPIYREKWSSFQEQRPQEDAKPEDEQVDNQPNWQGRKRLKLSHSAELSTEGNRVSKTYQHNHASWWGRKGSGPETIDLTSIKEEEENNDNSSQPVTTALPSGSNNTSKGKGKARSNTSSRADEATETTNPSSQPDPDSTTPIAARTSLQIALVNSIEEFHSLYRDRRSGPLFITSVDEEGYEVLEES